MLNSDDKMLSKAVNGSVTTVKGADLVRSPATPLPTRCRVLLLPTPVTNLATLTFDNTRNLAGQRRGKLHFTRVYFYNQILHYYGGIPLSKKPVVLDAPDFTVVRNTCEECINFIVAGLDSAPQRMHGT